MSTLAQTFAADSTSRWRVAAGLTLAVLVMLVGVFWPTFYSMVEVWNRSETFTHGYLIFPISAWLIWRRRAHLAYVTPSPDWRGLLLLAIAGAFWLLAEAGSIQIGAQYALIAMLIAAVWTMLGSRVVRILFFPLMFLFLAVPVGEFLLQPLMNFTADFTVAALQVTGIPVYREGTFFSVPSGDWSVVEACSGLRYLIASVTLGALFAYLTYRSWRRRALFTLAAFVVPVLANGVRAYMIVMIGHLSNMQLAVGIDHYIYGWVFFGLVMLLLFWIGSFWREDDPIPDPSLVDSDDMRGLNSASTSAFLLSALGVLTTAIAWPAYAHWLDQRALPDLPALQISVSPPWQPTAEFTDWRPHWVGSDRQFHANYAQADRKVMLELHYYGTQRQDAELINSQNYVVQQLHPRWSQVGQSMTEVQLEHGAYPVRQTLLKNIQGQRILVWQWNVIDGRPHFNDTVAKLMMATDRLRLVRDDGAAILLATPYEENPEVAARVLADFVRDNAAAIQRGLDQVAQQ